MKENIYILTKKLNDNKAIKYLFNVLDLIMLMIFLNLFKNPVSIFKFYILGVLMSINALLDVLTSYYHDENLKSKCKTIFIGGTFIGLIIAMLITKTFTLS